MARYAVNMTYADGSPGISFHPNRAAALAAAQAPTHGGRRVVFAEVAERLSTGAEVHVQSFRPAHAAAHDPNASDNCAVCGAALSPIRDLGRVAHLTDD